MKYKKLNKKRALEKIGGTSLKDRLNGWSYKQLVQAFGDPTFPETNGDGKINKEWVFERNDGEIFTVYDWKTGDSNVTTNFNTTWNIGSKVYAGEFVTEMITQLKKKN